ncbi:GerMN domain-containing protein [Candidatus Magnetomoraceae bacterium gMMP-15]
MNRKKKILLFIVLICFAISLTYRIMHPFKQEHIEKLTYNSQSYSKLKKESLLNTDEKPKEVCVLSNFFINPPKHSKKIYKNIFYKPEIIKEPVKQPEPEPEPELEPEPMDIKPVIKIEDPREKIRQELSQFRIFGSYESQGKKILFLEKGKYILGVRIGDRINGKYLIEDMTTKSITVKVNNIADPVHVNLEGF